MTYKRIQLKTVGKTLTKQSFANETNINKIMARYKKTGQFPHPDSRTAMYGDFSAVNTYQQAIHKITEADDLFASMPSDLRAQFNNDAGAFLEYYEDPENEDHLVELGMVAAPPTPAEALKPETPTAPPTEEDIQKNSTATKP